MTPSDPTRDALLNLVDMLRLSKRLDAEEANALERAHLAALPTTPAPSLECLECGGRIGYVATAGSLRRTVNRPTPTPSLDVERLARAIRVTFGGTPPTARQQAEAIARDYARSDK